MSPILPQIHLPVICRREGLQKSDHSVLGFRFGRRPRSPLGQRRAAHIVSPPPFAHPSKTRWMWSFWPVTSLTARHGLPWVHNAPSVRALT